MFIGVSAAWFQFGTKLSFRQLLKAIGNALKADLPWSSLVPIQSGDSKPAFFCVPGAGGNVIYLYDLARQLGPDQPFYALQAVDLDGYAEPHSTVEEMAAHYITCIQTVQIHGPYLLGGHSLGGPIAFEMVRQLTTQGHDVTLLAIFDTTAPPIVPDGNAVDEAYLFCEVAVFTNSLAATMYRCLMMNCTISIGRKNYVTCKNAYNALACSLPTPTSLNCAGMCRSTAPMGTCTIPRRRKSPRFRSRCSKRVRSLLNALSIGNRLPCSTTPPGAGISIPQGRWTSGRSPAIISPCWRNHMCRGWPPNYTRI